MNFLNPLFLIGLAAAGIPILLHLLNLRRMKTVEFSTLRFIKELQKTKIRKLRLKQIILLILRTLIVIFAVLAFARPTIEGTLPGFESYSKTSAVIILDNSFSMDVSDEFGNRFNRAKNSALGILDKLKEGDEAAIIRMSDPEDLSHSTFSENFNFLRSEIAKVKISNTKASLEKSIRLAASLLEDARHLNREIFIITDGQKNIFYTDINDTLNLISQKSNVFILPVGLESKTDIRNLSVDSLNIVSRIFQIDKLVEVEAVIKNNSDKDVDGVVLSMIFNDKRVAQRSVDIPGRETRTVSIPSEPKQTGVYRASVEIEGDALDRDNKRYFGFVIPDQPNIAVVADNGKNEFIRLSLQGTAKDNKQVNASFFSPDQFAGVSLENYDIVILASGKCRSSDLRRFEQYVKNGGSGFIFANENIQSGEYSEMLSNLAFGVPQSKSFERSDPAIFTSVEKMHPLFEGVFKGTTDKNKMVETAKIYKANPVSEGFEIISMPGGAFLSETNPEEGRTIYCAVKPSMEWSSLPLTGLFPSIMYRSTIYLTSNQDLGKSVEAGSPLVLSLPKKFSSGGNFKIVDPLGTEFFKQAAILPSGANISFDPFMQLGVYTVQSASGKYVSIISVNPPSSESMIDKPEKDDFKNSLASMTGDNVKVTYLDDNEEIGKEIVSARTGTELWQLFLLAALLCAVAEMIVEKNTKAEMEE